MSALDRLKNLRKQDEDQTSNVTSRINALRTGNANTVRAADVKDKSTNMADLLPAPTRSDSHDVLHSIENNNIGAATKAYLEQRTNRYGRGNIDLTNRPIYRNRDGSYSTVDSFSTNIDGKEVLLPTIGRDANGNAVRWTEQQAIDNYLRTGENLGKFDTVDEANDYAEWLHNQQADYYKDKSQSGWDYVGQQQAERARTSRGADIFRSWANRRAASDIDTAATISEAVAPGNELNRAARNEIARNAGGGFWGNLLADLAGMPSSGNQFADQTTMAMRSLDDSYVPALHEKADELNEKAAKADAAAKEGLGWLGTQAVNAATSGLDMLADKAETLLVPGLGLASMGFRTFGNSAGEARRDGADIRQQMIYGIANAAVEVGSEMIGDVADIYGIGLTDEFLDKVIKKIGADPALEFLIRGAASAAGESVEEAVAGALEPGLKAIYDNKQFLGNGAMKERYAGAGKETLESMFVGGVLGALGFNVQAGTGAAINAARNAPTNRANTAINNAYEAMAQNGMFSPEARQAAAQATEAAQKVRNSRTWKSENPTAAEYTAGRVLGEGTFFSNLGDEAVRAIVNEGLDSDEGTESRTLAEEYTKRLDNGGKISPEEIGRLYMANQDAIREEAWKNRQTVQNYSTESREQTAAKKAAGVRDIASVAAATMGERGARAAVMYRGNANEADPAAYYNEARAVYDQGVAGTEMQKTGDILSDAEVKAWYDAGKADAATQTRGETQNGEQIIEQSGNESQGRVDSLDSRGQSERLDRGADTPVAQNGGGRSTGTQDTGDAAQRIRVQKAAAEKLAANIPLSSSAEKGISTGTDFKTFREIPDSTREQWTEPMKTVTAKAEQSGVKVHWYTGRMMLDEGRGPFAVRGLNVGDGSEIWIRADADEDVTKIADHELFHTEEKRNPELVNEIRKRITEDKQDAQLLAMIRKYQDNYRNAGLSDEQMLSEIFADAGAGIDVFSHITVPQNAPETERVRAPQFQQQVNETVKNSKPTGAATENKTTMASREESDLPAGVQRTLDKYSATVQDGVVVNDSIAPIMASPEYRKPVSVSDLADMASHDTMPEWAQKYMNGGGSAEALQAIQQFDDMIWKDMGDGFTDAQKLLQALVPSGKVITDKYGPLRTNMEYRRSFDMDTSCPRTFQFTAYRNAIMKRLNRTLTFEESINLINLMSAYHQMIPCTYCYVENKRILKAAYYNNFYKFHNDILNGVKNGLTIEDLRPQMYGWDSKHNKLTDAAEKTLKVWMDDKSGYNPTIAENYHTVNLIRNAAMHLLDGMMADGKIAANTSVNSLTNIIAKEYGLKSKGALTEAKKMAADWRYDAGRNAEHMYLVQDTGEAFDTKIADRALELDNEAINYSNSASSAKTVDNYAPYGGELENISPEDRDYIMGMGGIRKHSSNDFRIDYVLDYFQFYADLAKGKWRGHTYTKNGDYVRIFGRTGDMINMSIAFNDAADGVTENVSEGMEHKLAKELRAAFPNAGVMAMVTSDKQLSYALNADWVDMIIPFHNSGLPKEIWYNMKAWADYTSVQSETLYNSDDMKAALQSRGIDAKGMSADEVSNTFYETFGVEKAVDTKTGKQFAPHFYPYETTQHGVKIPGHNNSKAKYMELCKQYGVHPRFDGVQVQDADGNTINVVDHPNYMKLVKETSRATENFDQPTIEFNFNKADPYLTEKYGKEYGKKSVTPMDYAMARLNEEAKNGGYQNAANDPMGIVDEFIREYAGKGREIGWLSERAEMTKDALDNAQDKLVDETRKQTLEEFKKTEGEKPKPRERSNFYANMASRDVTNEEPDTKYNIPEGYGIFIRNTRAKFVDKIFSGKKTVETRKSRTLDSYLHKWAPIVDTAKKQVIGEAYIDSVIEYDNPGDFRADAERHLVPETSKYNWKDGKGKRYGYVITDTRKYDTPIPVPEDAKKYGRIATQYSREDSDGRQLTAQQQKFFENSQVRDSQGRLQVVYHATDSDFTVYDRSKLGANTDGNASDVGYAATAHIGFWFNSADVSDLILVKGAKQQYLNITNPLAVDSLAELVDMIRSCTNDIDEYNDRYYDQDYSSAQQLADVFVKQIKDDGYDGIILSDEEVGGTSYVTFESNQAKDVANESPTANQDTRYSREEDIGDSKVYNRTVVLKEDTVDKYLQDYASKSSPKYAQAYIAYMSPQKFLNLTTSAAGRAFISEETKPLDLDKLKSATVDQPFQLVIDQSSVGKGAVKGHEGRHRATALMRAGVERIPVLLFDSSNKYSKQPLAFMSLSGQFNKYANEMVSNVQPLSYENRSKVIDQFTTQPTGERLQEKYNERETVRYSREVSDEEVKANADTAAKYFGTTSNWKETGYLLQDGRRLDFSGRRDGGPGGYRAVDHRDITDALGDDYGGTRYADGVIQFMREGNIRIMPEVGGINIQVEPTPEQYQALRSFIRTIGTKEGILLEFDDENGASAGSQEFDAPARADQVITAIEDHFAKPARRQSVVAQFHNMYSRETDNRLEKQNIDLQQRLDAALNETKLTSSWRAAAKDVDRVTSDIIDATSSKESKAIVAQKIRSLVEAASNGGITAAEMKDLSLDIARGLLKKSSVLTSPDSTTYDGMRKYLKSVYINVPMEMRKQMPDWKAFAAAHKAMRMKTDGVAISTVYDELRQRLGEDYFPKLTDDMDKLQQIAEILDNLTPIYDNPYSVNMAEATEETANGILEAILDIGQAEPTYADRAKAREGEVRSLYQEKLAAQKESMQQRLQEEADKRREQIEALKQTYRDMNEKRRNRKQESADRQKLLRVAKRLQNRKLDSVHRALVDSLVGDLDTVSVHLTNKSLTNLRELADWYDSFKDDPNFLSVPQIEEKIKRLEKRHIGDMTLDEVRDLTDVLRSIEVSLANYGKMVRTEDRRLVSEMSAQSQENIRNTKGKRSELGNWLATNTLSPERLVRRLTGYDENDPLYLRTKELSEGQRKMFDYQMRAEALFSKWTNDSKLIDRLRNGDTVKIRGFVDGKETTAEITPDMRMALYLHSLNDQNLKHIANGGVTIPDIELYRKGKIADAYAAGVTMKLSPDMVRGIASGMTAEERAFADAAHKYFNGMSRDEINAVSEALLGYSLAGVENYFPIQTDDAFTQKEIDAIQNDGTIQGMGFTKERQNASNAIYLVPMIDVLNRSIQNHAKYVGMAIPVANMNKLWKALTVDDMTDATHGLKDVMRAKWGTKANEAIDSILTDVQNPSVKTDGLSKFLANMRSNYAGAVLSLNAGVAIKQAASYPTAAAVLGWTPLRKAMTDLSKVDTDLIAKYTPLLWYRSKGYSTQELGDIHKRGGIMDKVMSAHVTTKGGREIPLLNWIQGVDVLTTKRLWKASEYYVQEHQKNLRTGTEDYYKAVAEVYNRVIEETQPNYTTMQRPQLLRTNNQLAQSLVMFKTQPFQNANILYDAIGELRAAERLAKNGDSSKLAEAKKNVANAVSSNIVSAVVFAAMTMAYSMFRRKKDNYQDEEGNFRPWKQLGKDFLSSEFGMLPFGTDLYDIISSLAFDQKYYGMSNVTTDSLAGVAESAYNAAKTMTDALSALLDGDEKTAPNPEKMARTLFSCAQDVSKAFGIPLDNVVNLMSAAYANIAAGINGEYVTAYEMLRLTKGMSSSANKSAAYDILYKAKQQNPAQYNELRSMMIDDGFKEANIDKAMKKRSEK